MTNKSSPVKQKNPFYHPEFMVMSVINPALGL